jgi:hypothetical protein
LAPRFGAAEPTPLARGGTLEANVALVVQTAFCFPAGYNPGMGKSRQFSMRQLLLFLALAAATLACFRTTVIFSRETLVAKDYQHYGIEILFGACLGGAGGALRGKAKFYAFAGLIAATLFVALQILF